GASGSDAQAQLADRYEEIGGALTELSSWFERLLPHRDLEGLYSSVRVPLYRARALEERLGVAESPLDEIETVASGFYDHWAHNTFAPDLSTIGSKFDVESEAGRQSAVAWLTDWILDPTRHNPETVMPRFRLESDDDGEQSVADIVAYLLTLRDPDFEATEALTPETLDEEKLATLRELTFNHLRASYSTARAQEISRSMPVEDQLRFVGHRLVRRYGCFGCHNGIADIDPDPGRAQTELVDADSVPTFDHAQPIGTELSTWGDKDVNRLDYGPWGHQPDGTAAIAHDRKDWLAAKLSDTRRFDVFPARKWVDKAEGHAVYVPTDRLIQKRPDELLVMPLFPFHDEPEVVDAVVTFVTSLVGDKIPVTKRNVLDGEERDIELGSRLVRKYNCLGCHRIGAETRTVALSELPSFTDLHEEDSRRAEWQKETWLARDFEVTRPLPSAPNASASLTLLKGMLLNIGTLDPTVDRDSPRAAVVDPVTVAQLIHRHYDPLPAFAQSVLQVLDEYADAEAVDPNVSAFVSAALAAAPGTNRFTEFLTRVRKAAFEESDQPYGAMLARLFDRPYDPAVVDWLATPEGDGEIWADLAREFYGRPLRRFSERNQRIPVRGLNEGSIRYYFGTD
ncbi:MAG TPA: hypothetical protein VK116_19770, partial [Planctomycetota bacterium]|nr:hypothetical protein [Planctomycetota bacterium]